MINLESIDSYHQEVESNTIHSPSSPPRLLQSLWRSDELPHHLDSSSATSSPVTTPRSHHKRINAIHGGVIATSSPSTHHQASPPTHYPFSCYDHLTSIRDINNGPDLSHRKEMLKKGTRIPLSLLASFDNYENLKRRRSMSSTSTDSKPNNSQQLNDQIPPSKPKPVSMPSSPVLAHVVDFTSFDNSQNETSTHHGECSKMITNTGSIPSSPTVSTPPRLFSKSYSASFLDFNVSSPSSIPYKKRPCAVKVETLSPNRSRLKTPLEPSSSSPNLCFKSHSSFQSNVKGLKKNLSPSHNQEQDLMGLHDFKPKALFV